MRLTAQGRELAPALAAVAPSVANQIHTVLVDQGYDNTEQITQVEREKKLLVLCPPQHRPNTKLHNPDARLAANGLGSSAD